jgi:hypothetical protein
MNLLENKGSKDEANIAFTKIQEEDNQNTQNIAYIEMCATCKN